MKKTKYYIETYGCQMNEYDSLVAGQILQDDGARKVHSPEEADVILLNTCAIRENAHTKIYNRLNSLAHIRKKGAQVGILGCMGQNLKEDLVKKDVPLDFIIGPDELRSLANLNTSNEKTKVLNTRLSRTELYNDLVPDAEKHLSSGKNPYTAFVTIQRGCDNFCSFCVVPYTRGRERSRSIASIVEEINHLVVAGYKSVVLLGQNVNSYLYKTLNFTELIKELIKSTSIERIYFTSPHPKDFPLELIDLMANEERFCSSVHLPLQSGSNAILKLMKRNYTREAFLELVQQFRERVPNVFISTDVIVGFCQESEADFEQTMEVMQLANFDAAFMFAYSKRKGTIASKLYEDDVKEADKLRRLEQMITSQLKRATERNQNYIGKTVEVLIQATAKKDKSQLVGQMSNSQKVVVSMPNTESEKTLLENYGGKKVFATVEKATSQTLISKFSHVFV